MYQGRNAPRSPPFACSEDGFCCTLIPRPPSKKKRVYGRNMVPPVRSRAARYAVPQWRFRRNARDRKGELAGPQALTEGLWVAYGNGLPVAGNLLLHIAYNPFASHPLSTSPYTGEARGGGSLPALHHFTGAARGGATRRFRRNARDQERSRLISFLLPFSPALRLFPAKQVLRGPLCI